MAGPRAVLLPRGLGGGERGHQVRREGVEYWGQVPVVVRIDDVEFTTALFPKDGRYLLPLKDAVRRPAEIEPGQVLVAALRVGRD